MLTGMVGIWEGWIMQHSGCLRALDRIYRLSLGFQPKEKLISFIFELVFFVRFHKSVSIAFPLFGNKTKMKPEIIVALLSGVGASSLGNCRQLYLGSVKNRLLSCLVDFAWKFGARY